jgi:beta-lactam-binding protein with PASTA domain
MAGLALLLLANAAFMWACAATEVADLHETERVTIPTFVNRRFEDIMRNEEYRDRFDFNHREEHSSETAPGVIISQIPAGGRVVEVTPDASRTSISLVVSLGEARPTVMPSLAGQHWGAARNELAGLGLNLIIVLEIVESNEHPDIVVGTTPPAGERLAIGDTVYIRYSGGTDISMVTVPALALPTTLEALQEAFQDLDLVIAFDEFEDSTLEEGTVTFIRNAGEEVPAGSEIHVSVSTRAP